MHRQGHPASSARGATTAEGSISAPSATTASRCRTPTDWKSQATARSSSIAARASAPRCHTKDDPKFCIDCHGLEMPHPRGWSDQPRQHRPEGPEAVRQKCHGKNSCIKCHGLQMPHPAGWLSQHTSARSRRRACATSATRSSFCFACHGVDLPHSAASSPTTRTTCTPGQRLHEVPRQRRHGPARLLRWPVPRGLHQVNPEVATAPRRAGGHHGC